MAGRHSQMVQAIRSALPNVHLTTGRSIAVRGARGFHGEPDLLIISEEPALIVVEVEQTFSALKGLEQVREYIDGVRRLSSAEVWGTSEQV